MKICGECKDQSKTDEDGNTEVLSEIRSAGLENHYSEPMWVNFVVFLADRKSTRLNSSHSRKSRMPSSA